MLNLQFDSIFEFLNQFPDEQSCIDFLEKVRWEDGNIISPFDKTSKVYVSKNNRYKCKNTDKYFNVRTGTMFENTKIPLRKWFLAIYLVTNHKKGISSHQLARDIDVTQKTAWFMLHRMQNCLKVDYDWCLQGTVQIDETFVGGKNGNRHWDKKVPQSQGRSFKDKTPVLGMISDDGAVITKVVKNTSAKSLLPLIDKFIVYDSVVYTDEWKAYRKLSENYNHSFVLHEKKQYVTGNVTTNKIESYWSHLKRCIFGIHHSISRKYLQYYLDCQAFRFMTRNISSSERFHLFLQNMGCRLKHKILTDG